MEEKHECGGCGSKSEGASFAEGKFAEYYPETGRYLEYECSGGIRDGYYKEFEGEEMNKLRVEGSYKNGLVHGVWTYYSSEGNTDKIKVYNEGRLAEER
jgi:antitoxin component YwqK of YwqJK toxin-antitoxin module